MSQITGINILGFSNVIELLEWILKVGKNIMITQLIKPLVFYCVREIWLHRNAIIFDKTITILHTMVSCIIKTVYRVSFVLNGFCKCGVGSMMLLWYFNVQPRYLYYKPSV